MGGGLMQLVAYGAQDIYLTGNPQITFFKVVYRRHTNFSLECIQQTMNGAPKANGRSTCTISRNGDLVNRMHVRSSRGSTAYENEGNGQFSNVILEIGGQQIDKQSGHWMEVYTELTKNTTGRQFGTDYQVATGTCEGIVATNASTAGDRYDSANDATVTFFTQTAAQLPQSAVIYTPLHFWFCRNPGLALPLIALQYHEVKVIFEWSETAITDQELWVDYIYLDTDERRRFAQVSHEYLIEQVQVETGAAKASQKLNFNHPVKELIWTGAASTGSGSIGLGAHAHALNTDTFHLKLNGHDRMSPQPVTYYTRLMPQLYHSGSSIIADSIAVYSFALKPEEHQPSGTCNFSRIDNAQLVCSVADGVSVNGKIFAVNYNVLRIMSGMGGLAYSN